MEGWIQKKSRLSFLFPSSYPWCQQSMLTILHLRQRNIALGLAKITCLPFLSSKEPKSTQESGGSSKKIGLHVACAPRACLWPWLHAGFSLTLQDSPDFLALGTFHMLFSPKNVLQPSLSGGLLQVCFRVLSSERLSLKYTSCPFILYTVSVYFHLS